MNSIPNWCARHRLATIAIWVALLAGAIGAAVAVGPSYSTSLTLDGTETQRASELLRREATGDVSQVVLHGTIDRARVDPMLERLAGLAHVTSVGELTFSPDRRTAFATITFDADANDLPSEAAERVIETAQAIRTPALRVELGGAGIAQAQAPSLGVATPVALIAALVVLLVTFGSLPAAGLPIVTALFGLGTGVAIGILASHVVDTVNFSTEVGVMVGLGVGIDYALFILTRFREAHRAGEEDPIGVAMATAGHAVLFAGATVIVALLGLFLLGVSLLYGLGLASALTVLFTMLAALTVLPALTGERLAGRARGRGRRELWRGWAGFVTRHPWPALAVSLAVMLGLSAPVLSLRLGTGDAGNDPSGTTTRAAYDLLAAGFGPGFNGPLIVVGAEPVSAAAIATLRASEGVAEVVPGGRTATVFPASAPQDEATTALVHRLRAELPDGLFVGGPTAASIDFSQVLEDKLPLFVGVVVLVSALLLLVVFRSLVIPVQAALMNLLSMTASLGVVVAVFQHGWLGGLIGVEPAPIEAFIPVVMFAIVFGLSMDYEVFLVSRIREEWERRGDATEAVVEGVASTGRVITAAATIMVCVFGSFVLADIRGLKLFGVSFATAVFLDAFVIRSLMLPAVLQLLGRRTWWWPARRPSLLKT